jgi:UDP-GlcNAc:undecaprenyl-phosphate/decaprenyl-phosphate GlcNAc-1-phosphate transferase
MNYYYISIYFVSVLLTALAAFFIIKIARRYNIVDAPTEERKIHIFPVPLLGGGAVFFTFFIIALFVRDKLVAGDLEAHHWFGVFGGAAILMVGGYLDDKYGLKPKHQVIFPLLAALAVIAGGVAIEKITNPLGGFIYMNQWLVKMPFGFLGGPLSVVSALVIFIWLLGMMYTTKLLDGLDGLVCGLTAIGAVIIFIFTMTDRYYQPDIGLAALILAGSCTGFLIFNWHPAKIFLGEGGSLFLGFILGVLAIISGGKIAIALLVMGLPVMDVVWTIVRRLKSRKNPFTFADRQHLHFRLLDLGLTQRKTVIIYYTFATVFGLSALFLQSKGKLLAVSAIIIIMIGFVAGFYYLDRNKNKI